MDTTSPLAILDPILHDPAVTEILIDGPARVTVERRGQPALQDAGIQFPSVEALRAAIDAALALGGAAFQPGQTVAEARLPDGSRVLGVLPPTAVNAGPYLVVRKFWKTPLTFDQLVEFGSVSRAGVAVLRGALLARRNLVVAGGTGSGKTTVLNLLTDLIPAAERVVAVEAFFELHLRHPRAINLCSDSSPDLTYGDLINTAAKMRPDRLVFSELRGPETLRIMDLLRGGYDGSLAAIHATSAEDALARLETQCLTANLGLGLGEIRAIIASAVNVISVQQRQPATGARKIVEIVEVDGLEHDRYRLQPLVRYEPATEEFKVLGKPSWE